MTMMIVAAVLGAPLTLFLHELAHVVSIKAKGGRILSFKPYPHVSQQGFVFGYVTYLATQKAALLSAKAPMVKAIFLGTLYVIFAQQWSWRYALAVWEGVDLLWWLHGYVFNREGSDGAKLRG